MPKQSRRGSLILIALIFSLLIVVVVASYLKLATSEYKQADTAFMRNALLNLNEAGAEDAMWSINKEDFNGWSYTGAYRYKSIPSLDLGNGKKGFVNIIVQNVDTFPVIYTEGRAIMNDGKAISKQVRMALTYRTLFANGLTAKDKLRIAGGSAMIDSYRSDAGPPDPTTNRWDKGTIGTLSIEFENLDAGNSDVYGYVATGGGAPAFGPGAKVYGADWAPGDPPIDPTRVTLDFTADFPNVDPPVPSPGALGDSDEDIAYLTGNGGPGSRTVSGGLSTAPLEYHLSEFDMNNNRELIIGTDSHVVMRVDGDVDISNLHISSGSSLTLYASGDITVSGNGYANDNNQSETFVVYGTNNGPFTASNPRSEITLNGSAGLSAAVYAPNANLTMNGGGSGPGFSGASVANDITLNGGVAFHYDEGLEDFYSNDPNFKLKSWFELADRADRIDFSLWTTAMADIDAFEVVE